MRKMKKLYLITLTASLFSLVLSMGLITALLHNNPILAADPSQNLAQLEILDSQKGLLQLISMLPTLIFILNLVLAAVIYSQSECREAKSFHHTMLWILLSAGYQALLYTGMALGFSIDILTLPLMAAAWLSKAWTCRTLWQEVRAGKPAQKGALCAS